MIDSLQKPTEADVKQAAESQVLFEARQKLDRKYQSDLASGQAQHEAVHAHRRDVEAAAVQSLAGLRDLYAARAAAAQRLAAAVAEFAQAEDAVKSALQPIDRALGPVWSGIDGNEQGQRMAIMRRSAGLLGAHGDIGAAGIDRLGRTVCGGIVGGFIAPGSIGAGRGAVQFE